MPSFEQGWQQIVRFVQERQTALASGLAALLIIVVGFLIFNFFLNVNKDTVPQETTFEEATESAELSPTETPLVTVTSTPTPTPEKTTAQVSPGGAASVTQNQEYTVVKGDTLGKIAQKFYNDPKKWTLVAEASKLTNPSIIHAGNKLIIPKSETGVSSSTTVSPAPRASSGNVEYVVTSGDTLWQIAVDFYGSGFDWYKIRDANLDKIRTLPNGRPGISPGQHLIIP